MQYLSHAGFLLPPSGNSAASSEHLPQNRTGLPYLLTRSEAGTRALTQAVTPQFPYMVSEQDVELGVVIKCYFVWFFVDQLRRKVVAKEETTAWRNCSGLLSADSRSEWPACCTSQTPRQRWNRLQDLQSRGHRENWPQERVEQRGWHMCGGASG